MIGDERLRRIWEAQQRPDAARTIGDLVEPYGGRHAQAMLRILVEIRRVIAAVVDQPFKDHCQRMSYDAGLLTIGVDDPGMVYMFRRRYLFLLRQQLGRSLPHVLIQDIRFKAVRMDGNGVPVDD